MKSLILICAVGMAFGQTISPEEEHAAYAFTDACRANKWQGKQLWKGANIPCAVWKEVLLADPKTAGVVNPNSGMSHPYSVHGYDPGDEPVKPEPLDVPAIQEIRKVPKDQCRIAMPISGIGTFNNCLPEEKVWTCADKERILEHSENGKYWCRKVQP